MRPRRPAFFDPEWYLEINPDVEAAGVDPSKHYMSHGRFEGRMPCSLVAAARERDFQLGFSAAGETSLIDLCSSSQRPERVWARIAMARIMLDRGEAASANSLLTDLDTIKDLVRGFALLDPLLLAIEAATTAGDRRRARLLLAIAFASFGARPDLCLAAANLAAARSGPGLFWRYWIGSLYAKRGLRGLALGAGSCADSVSGSGAFSLFDRIQVTGSAHSDSEGPLVSVVVPARDAEGTIGTALRGLSDQSWRRLEILVVDNGSKDATTQIVSQHMERDARIRLVDGSAEPGAYAARNLGMAAARGEFLTVHDADDWSHPDRVRQQVQTLSAQPSLRACLAYWVNVTPDLRFVRWWKNDGLIHQNISSLMIRRDTFETLGYWDRVRVAADTEYVDRIVAAWGRSSLGEVCPGVPLTLGRRSGTSLTRAVGVQIETIHRGPRRRYLWAMGEWHRAARVPADLYLSQRPARRPFIAPSPLMVGDQPPAHSSLRECPLFDEDWMLNSYSDLRREEVDPLMHYVEAGAGAGRDPGPDFSSSAYLLDNECGDLTPLAHHLAQTGPQIYLPDLPGSLPAPLGAPKILFVGHQARAQVFGAERALLGILDRATEAGIVPIVVLPQAMNHDYLARIRARSHSLHIRPMGWRYGGLTPPARTVEHLVELVRRYGVAEVHQNSCVLDAPLYAARIANVPCTVHLHELPASDPRLCFDLGTTESELRHDLLVQADRFISVSMAVTRWIDAGGRTTTLPNRIDTELFNLPFSPGRVPVIALIGSLSPKKGVGEVAEIARRFAAAGGTARFVLIGSCPDQARLALPANMTHEQYVPDSASAIAMADIILSVSRVAESFGRTVLEGMAAGRPIMCWDRGAPPEIVGRDGMAGSVVPAGDISAAVTALLEITSDNNRLLRMSDAARRRARSIVEASERIAPETIFQCLEEDKFWAGH